MASNRKKVQPPAYNDPGWGDSISVSKKARQELAETTAEQEKNTQVQEYKGTTNLKEYSSYYKTPKKTPAKPTNSNTQNKKTEYSEVNNQVDQINNEINKAVNEIEGVLERFLNQLYLAVSNFFLAFYSLILKIFLLVFVEPLRNAGKMSTSFLNMLNQSLEDVNNWLSGNPSSKPVKIKRVTASLQQAVTDSNNEVPVAPKQDSQSDIKKKYPAVFDGIRFGELAVNAIVFLNIKNNAMYDIKRNDFTIEEEQEMLDNAIKEIHNCAKLAKSLPSPSKGRYMNRPMVEILENARMEDLKAFLQYVYTHPKPFIDRQLRLSEAFATWAHKGAPV